MKDQPTTAHSFLPLHALEFQTLLSLSAGSAHAYAIVQAIEKRQPAWSPVQPTNMYRRIWRLAADGLIEQIEAPPNVTDPRRKYFAITELGSQVAAAEAARLRSLLRHAEEAGIVAREVPQA